MRKQVLIIAAVSAIVLFVFYLIGALTNVDAIHDIHTGIEDRAIMQSNNTVYAGQVEQYGILHVDSATAYADDEFVRFAEKAAEFVSRTVESGHEYAILFCIEASNGCPIVIERNKIAWDYGPKWRKRCKEAVYSELMNNQEIHELYDAGETVDKLSTTISYMHEYCVASVCDTDCDGFVDEKHVSSL